MIVKMKNLFIPMFGVAILAGSVAHGASYDYGPTQ